jgi:hypothetical protein
VSLKFPLIYGIGGRYKQHTFNPEIKICLLKNKSQIALPSYVYIQYIYSTVRVLPTVDG